MLNKNTFLEKLTNEELENGTYLIVGETGSGKTFFIKEYIAKANIKNISFITILNLLNFNTDNSEHIEKIITKLSDFNERLENGENGVLIIDDTYNLNSLVSLVMENENENTKKIIDLLEEIQEKAKIIISTKNENDIDEGLGFNIVETIILEKQEEAIKEENEEDLIINNTKNDSSFEEIENLL